MFWTAAVAAQDYYQWTDKQGRVHFTDSIENIPPSYRPKTPPNKAKPEPKSAFWTAPTAPTSQATPPSSKPRSALDAAPKLRHFKVPYRAKEGDARRVIIPVTLNGRIEAQMLLDTGSPGLHIGKRLTNKLGLTAAKNGALRITAAGIGGVTPATLTIIDTVSVGEETGYQAEDHFIPTTVIDDVSTAFDGIIGMDFLSRYNLSIDARNRVVVFHELPANPDEPGGRDEDWWRSTFKAFRDAYKGWRQWRMALESLLGDERLSSADRLAINNQRQFAQRQEGEANHLLDRLERYASDQSVPRHWR